MSANKLTNKTIDINDIGRQSYIRSLDRYLSECNNLNQLEEELYLAGQEHFLSDTAIA